MMIVLVYGSPALSDPHLGMDTLCELLSCTFEQNGRMKVTFKWESFPAE